MVLVHHATPLKATESLRLFCCDYTGLSCESKIPDCQTGQPLLGKLEFSHAECHAKVVHLERVWNPALERQAGWKPSPDLFGYPDCPGSKTHFSWWCFMLRFFLFPFSFGVTWNLGYNQNHLLVMMPVMHKLNTFFHTIWRGRFANSISNTGSPKNRWVWD